jgi:DNA-directed RNA polymerase subunit M/transcription elongation factor TFIIS
MANDADEYELPACPACPQCGSKAVFRQPRIIGHDTPTGVLYFRCQDCAEVWTLRLTRIRSKS